MASAVKKGPAVTGARLVPWSHSRLKDYERCPRYAYEVHVNKNRGPASPAMDRGTALHLAAENFVNGVIKTLPKDFQSHRDNFKELRSSVAVRTELKFGITAQWTITDFFGDSTWGRGIIDVLAVVPEGIDVIDHKSGRKYPEHADQLRLYSVVGLAIEPRAPRSRAMAWYLDLPPSENEEFVVTRAEAGLIRNDFEKRVIKMVTDNRMLPRPNQYCRRCHLNKRNGGTCDAPG